MWRRVASRVRGINAYVFIGNELKTDRYKDTDHQVCLAHVRAKFVKAWMEGGDKRTGVFLGNINWLFHFEREYDREMITDGNVPDDGRGCRPWRW